MSNSTRAVAKVVYGPEHEMGPLTIRQPLPSDELPYLDPFVLLHHAPPRTADGQHGLAAHPHRGFAPVSFIYKGGVRHRDSQGNDSTITAGGTQWMHAGRGILHEENPLAGENELIQLWINTPAVHKLDTPTYHPLSREATPRFTTDDGLIAVNVIAGSVLGLTGPIPTLSPLNAATIEAQRNGRITIAIPPTHNAFIYVLDGALSAGAHEPISGFRLAAFAREGDSITIEALEDTRALLMSGEPIGEPIVSYGPFVMNTEDEIRQAFREYRAGLFGEVAPLTQQR
jgi:redox-sensitive bicupin YhaK (pirin superfamily)